MHQSRKRSQVILQPAGNHLVDVRVPNGVDEEGQIQHYSDLSFGYYTYFVVFFEK